MLEENRTAVPPADGAPQPQPDAPDHPVRMLARELNVTSTGPYPLVEAAVYRALHRLAKQAVSGTGENARDDAAQDALIYAWRLLKIEPRRAPMLVSLLRHHTRRRLARFAAQDRRWAPLFREPEADGQEAEAPDPGFDLDAREQLEAALGTLPDRQREVTRLRLAGLSTAAVAAALGLSEPTVRKYEAEARANLEGRAMRERSAVLLAWVWLLDAGSPRQRPRGGGVLWLATASIGVLVGVSFLVPEGPPSTPPLAPEAAVRTVANGPAEAAPADPPAGPVTVDPAVHADGLRAVEAVAQFVLGTENDEKVAYLPWPGTDAALWCGAGGIGGRVRYCNVPAGRHDPNGSVRWGSPVDAHVALAAMGPGRSLPAATCTGGRGWEFDVEATVENRGPGAVVPAWIQADLDGVGTADFVPRVGDGWYVVPAGESWTRRGTVEGCGVVPASAPTQGRLVDLTADLERTYVWTGVAPADCGPPPWNTARCRLAQVDRVAVPTSRERAPGGHDASAAAQP